jgi:hypothetical protein
VVGATVGGGGQSDWVNEVTADFGTLGGGEWNAVTGPHGTVGGGAGNTANNECATVSGGASNHATGSYATVSGGTDNVAIGTRASVGGGYWNTAGGYQATIGGGAGNSASSSSATIGGGGGNTASGVCAAVPGGCGNTAQGDWSFAAGRRAKAYHTGVFVWADSTDADFESTANDQFLVRATGGVSFSTGSAPFLINGDTVWHPANVVVVAKSGGDYVSIQAAVDSVADAAADNPYLVWVAPGVYSETVTLKPYVHLQGAGQGATVISSTVSSSSSPPTQATLVLTHHVSLRDLTVGNSGAGGYNVALLATAGTTQTLVADVNARVQGSGTNNHAIYLTGGGTGVTLQGVKALGENGSDFNCGLCNDFGAVAMLRGGFFTARGGQEACGIHNFYLGGGGRSTLEAQSVVALGENGSSLNCGLHSNNDSAATLRGGSFTARGLAFTTITIARW